MNETEIIALFYPDADVHTLSDSGPLPPPHSNILVSTDAMIEGTHFRRDWSSPEDVAVKLFHVNLSDIAAGGADPEWCTLNAGIPAEAGDEFLRRFARAFRSELERYHCKLVGGDTFRSPVYMFSVTMGGGSQRFLSRDGGKAGDRLYVTGNLGLSGAGYKHLANESLLEAGSGREAALEKHRRPRARYDWAKILRSTAAVHAIMDVSDGLLADARRLAAASGVTIEIAVDRIPVPRNLVEIERYPDALLSGEELELLFLGEDDLRFEFPCTDIGVAVAPAAGDDNDRRGSVRLRDGEGRELQLPGGEFKHF